VEVTTYPTGDQYEITFQEQRAVITEVGATLRVYSVNGKDVIAGFAEDEVVQGGRGMQLLPWPNRIRDGRYTFNGVDQQLALSEPTRHNAIHGLVRHIAWDLMDSTGDSVTQRVRVYPEPGWPGILEVTITHTLSSEGLEVAVTATNIGSTPVPFGYAAHPYFTVGENVVDDIVLELPAATYLDVDDRLLPIALVPVEGREQDFRSAHRLGSVNLDTAYTDLTREADGRARVRLQLGDRYAEMWCDASYGWLQVFTGEHLRDINLAIEPMTCGPNAFNPGPTQDGVIVLEPAASFSGRWGVTGH
jgi:aldose 1-epimerase